ncbi:hypothetical protein WDZ17_00650 [Pseudokineococcus basanitobsidens]|uniref:Anti-sigma-K factor rskA n=1 Tax=Pseudokineococcus basanitobsidens TaxID=1926649 RepID=A0ABU8RFE9_9ACTN
MADAQGDDPGGRDRRAELLGGAATDDLDVAERAELERLLADDPSAARELEELRSVLAALPPRGSGWVEAPAPPAGDLDVGGRRGTGPHVDRATRRRRPWALGAAAAALVVGGAGAALGVESLVERPPAGPAGTLGAVEQVELSGGPTGVDADLAVVAHTWGTETVLDVAGLEAGVDYRLVLLDRTGRQVSSGGFVGADAVVECRLNAPVLREDARRLAVLGTGGETVLAADLPPV